MKTIKILLCLLTFLTFNNAYALWYEVLHDCNNQGTGKITLTAPYEDFAANAPFRFQWYDAKGKPLLDGINKPNNVLKNLYAGTYMITISDKDGCNGTYEIIVKNINRTPCIDSIFSTKPKEEPFIPTNLFTKSTEQGLLKVVPTLSENKKYYNHTLLLIHENGVDTIVHKTNNIVDVVFNDDIYHVLCQNMSVLSLYQYPLKGKEQNNHRPKFIMGNPYSVSNFPPYIQEAFFITEDGKHILVKHHNYNHFHHYISIFSKNNNKNTSIFNNGDTYTKTYSYHSDLSPSNYPFESKIVEESLLNINEGTYEKRQKLYNKYWNNTSFLKEYLQTPRKRSNEIHKHIENLLLEEVLNEKGYTYQQEDNLNTFEILLDSTGIYIQHINKENLLKPIPTEKDSLIILRNPIPKAKIAELPKEGNIRWSWLKDNLLSITFPDDTQKIYYIGYFNQSIYRPDPPEKRALGVFELEAVSQ